MIHVGRHFDVLRDQTFQVRVDVSHHVVVVLGVVEHVDIDDPAEFAGGRHVRLPREDLAAILRSIDDQGRITMIPIPNLFPVIVGLGLDFFPVSIRIQRDIERIFAGMDRQTGSRPWSGRPASSFIVTGPGMLPGAELSYVARDDEHHGCCTAVGRHMEVVRDTFAVVNRGRLDCARVACPADDQVLWRAADLVRGIQVIVLEVD